MPSIEYKVMTRQREEIQSLKARIAELERCVVLGGDGKPIAVGDPIFVSELHTARTGARVLSLYRQRSISGHEPCVEVIYDNGMKEGIEAIFCYSSPDSVPEGNK